MRISQIEIYKSPIKLKEPFVISLGVLDFAENIIVIIRTDSGITGFGECSPFMTINGENMDTCFIVAQFLAKAIKGIDPLNIQECSQAMDMIIYGNSSIKSAFDIALYDIASQNSGLPLYRFLSGSKDKTLITDYTVCLGPAEKMANEAKDIKDKGFQIIKVKLGDSRERDVQRIRMIREIVGDSVALRIDANQGWNVEEAVETLVALAPYQIQFCEEPIPRWNYMELSKVRSQSPIPIMADESCLDHNDAKRLIELSSCDLFNIKLGKSSGIFKALKIIRLAEQAGVKIQFGGFLESRLGFTASAHLALTVKDIPYCDFDSPLMFVEDPVIGGITYDNQGVITIPETPGLGATIDERYLRKLTKTVVN